MPFPQQLKGTNQSSIYIYTCIYKIGTNQSYKYISTICSIGSKILFWANELLTQTCDGLVVKKKLEKKPKATYINWADHTSPTAQTYKSKTHSSFSSGMTVLSTHLYI